MKTYVTSDTNNALLKHENGEQENAKEKNTSSRNKKKRIEAEIERKLYEAAGQLPGPQLSCPISPAMQKRCSKTSAAKEKNFSFSSLPAGFSHRVHPPFWRTVLLTVVLIGVGTVTVLAANPDLRERVIHFFTNGTMEQPPIDLQFEEDTQNTWKWDESLAGELSAPVSPTFTQTAGSLTVTQSIQLDSHFTVTYASSSDFLNLVRTPSGNVLYQTTNSDGTPSLYYSIEDGILTQVPLERHSLTASFTPTHLPGIMAYDGDWETYQRLVLPAMEFTVSWQQYENEILIDPYVGTDKFDIQDTFGGELGGSYDGAFQFKALPNRSDAIIVYFILDGQRTAYCYPFLLDLNTGEVIDILASTDLSAFACLQDMALSDDLTQITAQAGSDPQHLQTITIDLSTGESTGLTTEKPPVSNCYTWFATGEHTLFYTIGTETDLEGYLYDTKTQTSTLLFTDTAMGYDIWDSDIAPCYIDLIGGGYAIYYEEDCVSLLDLHNGSFTQLEGIRPTKDMSFFFNPDYTLLSYAVRSDPDSFNIDRLGFIDPDTGEAWYFDRSVAEEISERTNYWYSSYGYVIQAVNTDNETHYLYLYEYIPSK